MAEGKRLYRPAEAAESLGISRARLYQLMGSGELPSVKLGASRRVLAADLDAYVARLRAEPGTNGHAEPTTPTRATA